MNLLRRTMALRCIYVFLSVAFSSRRRDRREEHTSP